MARDVAQSMDSCFTTSSSDDGRTDEALSGRGPFQIFFEDDEGVMPKNRIPYMMMMASDVIDGFDVTTTHPFSKFVNKDGYKRKLQFSKGVLKQEIQWRDPKAKPNASNKSMTDLQAIMKKTSEKLDVRDIFFIKTKVEEFKHLFSNQLEGDKKDDTEKANDGRQTRTDRLRFILAFGIDHIMVLYRKSQDTMTRREVDGRNSDNRALNFFEAIVKQCNDEDWIVETEAVGGLHDDYGASIECKKGHFTFSVKNAKALLHTTKHRLDQIIKRYEASGNGSNMLESDNEEEEEPTRETIGRQWGRFNKARADREAERKQLKNGDDRQSFLQHFSSDLLYWWWFMDNNDLIHFTIAELDGENAASCDSVPKTTAHSSRKRGRRKNDEAASSKKDSPSTQTGTERQDMVNAALKIEKRMGHSLTAGNRARKQKLEEQRFGIEMQMLSSENPQIIAACQTRINAADTDIAFYEKAIAAVEGVDEDLQAVPRQIEFDEDN